MQRTNFSIRAHERPLTRVPDYEIDQYLVQLEDALNGRIEDLDSAENPLFPEVERNTYEQVLGGLEEVESVQDLYELSDEVVETESVFPSPFEHLGIISNSKEFLKASYLEQVYEEARESYEEVRTDLV